MLLLSLRAFLTHGCVEAASVSRHEGRTTPPPSESLRFSPWDLNLGSLLEKPHVSPGDCLFVTFLEELVLAVHRPCVGR